MYKYLKMYKYYKCLTYNNDELRMEWTIVKYSSCNMQFITLYVFNIQHDKGVLFNFNTFSFILVLQNNFSHSTLENRENCEKQIFPSVGFEPTTSCTRGKRLTA